MKKILLYTFVMFFAVLLFSLNSTEIEAKKALATKNLDTISGDTIGTIAIYDNGEVAIGYKYGLRLAKLSYCEKGEKCDSNIYTPFKIIEASINDYYKGNGESLKMLSHKITELDTEKEYGIRVEAYFGVNSGYKGIESILGSPSISSMQVLETDTDKYVKPTNSGNYGDAGIDKLMSKAQSIVNTFILPILYAGISLFVVIKGAILGVQIVKSADDPNVRAEKVRALKWLVIGVGVAYAASTLVAVVTGFFKDAFS